MAAEFNTDDLHRLVKQQLDSGAASSVEEALATFGAYRLDISIDAPEAENIDHQAALLTAVSLARRVFLGGVVVSGCLKVPQGTPLPIGGTLGDAIESLGGAIGDPRPGTPTISIGGAPRERISNFHIRTQFAGWRGGIVPAHAESLADSKAPMALAPMLAAALAINEAFLWAQNGGSAIGARPVGLSLWCPSSDVDWLDVGDSEPPLLYLPDKLWLIGLGHLGQAYLWGLGLLQYPDPSKLDLVLQDVDVVTGSTESTSVLSNASHIDQKKTRVMAAWCERRGFSTRIHERYFASDFKRQRDEPRIALCGLHNALDRRALDQVGFGLVVEAGLGNGHRDFRTIQLHTLPSDRMAMEIWKDRDKEVGMTVPPAYKKLFEEGKLDQCGITTLAGKAVGAPFVGAAAACLVLSEVLRHLHRGQIHKLVDLDLLSLDQRTVVNNPLDFSAFNPGFVRL